LKYAGMKRAVATKRMTEQEYVERLSQLLERIRREAAPTDDEAVLFERYRDAEFDLTVDHRLGLDFPRDRRAQLGAVHHRTRERTEALKQRLLAGDLSREEFAAAMQAAVEAMEKDYREVLTPAEMSAFFGGNEDAFRLAITPETL
jgi:hypothetical protein